MRDRIRATLITLVTLGSAFALPIAARAATPSKVVIIVGPTGSVTSSYRSQADQIAAAAVAGGATVVKVYSPNATWAKVKAAVNGANIIVYLGHGNGYPNPYTSTLMADRTNGWGLNRTSAGGDGDNWSTTMVYCGEKALTGTLTSADGAAQRTYCTGGRITPAPGFVMIYAGACYAPGASEPGTTAATPNQALQRASYYSRSVLASLGASGYFATDHGATPLVHDLLTSPGTTYGAIYAAHVPSGVVVTDSGHLLVGGNRVKLGKRSSDPYYTYAFAGDPSRVFGVAVPANPAPAITARNPGPKATGVSMSAAVVVRFSEPVSGVAGNSMALRMGNTVLGTTVSYDPTSRTATLRTSLPLAPGATYSMALSGRIQDASGKPLAWTTWTFTTTKSEAYSPNRTLTFQPGTYTAYRFSSTGAVTSSRRYSLAHVSNAPTSRRASIPAHAGGWYYVASGVWAGYWMHEASSIALH